MGVNSDKLGYPNIGVQASAQMLGLGVHIFTPKIFIFINGYKCPYVFKIE